MDIDMAGIKSRSDKSASLFEQDYWGLYDNDGNIIIRLPCGFVWNRGESHEYFNWISKDNFEKLKENYP